MRIHHLIVALLLAALTTGCMDWADAGQRRPGSVSGEARVVVGGVSFPVYGAKVVASGATNAVTSTRRDGAYELTRLREGHHQLQLQALHGAYTNSLYVYDTERLDWTAKPGGIDPDLFFELSALKRVWLDQYNVIRSAYDGELVRWEKKQISVYMDVYGAPAGVDSRLAEKYWEELRRWEQHLAYSYTFVKVGAPERADIVVRWVPAGFLGDQAGITRQVAHYYNGALKRVEIDIDVYWADFPGVWEHEVGRAMGLGAVSDKNSVMYPRLALSGPQRRTLSSHEAAHVRLMYDIPSGRRLDGGAKALTVVGAGEAEWGAGDGSLSDGDANGEPAATGFGATVLSAREAPVTGVREHMLRLAPDTTP